MHRLVIAYDDTDVLTEEFRALTRRHNAGNCIETLPYFVEEFVKPIIEQQTWRERIPTIRGCFELSKTARRSVGDDGYTDLMLPQIGDMPTGF